MCSLLNLNLISWNLNGIRAVQEKGLLSPLFHGEWDIVAFQETKAQRAQLNDQIVNQLGYQSFWANADRKGYSGTALFIKDDLAKRVKVMQMQDVIGFNEFDCEGRTLIADFGSFVLINCYFPNSQEAGKRIDYKVAFNQAIHKSCVLLGEGNQRPVLLCGDYNVAVREIDLANPERNHKNPGFLPEERSWMESFLVSGYIDSFRLFFPELCESYTWWSYRTKARERNIGWRIDYFCINQPFSSRLVKAGILSDVMGSDHCPVFIEVKL